MSPVHICTLTIAGAACVTDLRTRRIPNVLTFGAALAGLVFQFATGGVEALGQAALGWLLGALVFLLPSRYCPSDKLESRAREIVGTASPGYGQVEAIRAWIQAHLEYRYGSSNVSTDAADTLAAGAGVCRDFAHVGIALTRALRIPARMVVGYLHQLEPMDLHAWFEAFVGGRWYTFDATQQQPRGGRVVLAYGRDAADVAFISNYGPLVSTKMTVWADLAPPPAEPFAALQ